MDINIYCAETILSTIPYFCWKTRILNTFIMQSRSYSILKTSGFPQPQSLLTWSFRIKIQKSTRSFQNFYIKCYAYISHCDYNINVPKRSELNIYIKLNKAANIPPLFLLVSFHFLFYCPVKLGYFIS